ncbi:MAG: M1 family metallopeptidase [Acidimicrobiales bacterium]
MSRRAIAAGLALTLALLVACGADDRVLPDDDPDVPDTTRGDDRPGSGSTGSGVGAPGLGDDYFPALGNGGYDVTQYTLEISYDPASAELDGTATIDAEATQELTRFNLDLTNLEVADVSIDGEPATFEHEGQELTVTPDSAIDDGAGFTMAVDYGGIPDPIDSTALGQVGWNTTADGTVYVLSEPEGASTWFPANDHPLDKAPFTFRVTVPDGLEVAANGLLQSQTPTGDGRTTWEYEATDPMAPYLATVEIGQFVFEQTEGPGGLPIRNAFAESLAADATFDFGRTGEMIELFATLFGPYPFEAYGAVVVDDFIGVALETQTMSLFGAEIVDGRRGQEEIVAHELAHQWFGDSVSLARWQDIWLNEGFATYAQWIWGEHAGGRSVDSAARQSHSSMRTNPDLGLPPPGDPGPPQLFAASVYIRGALTLHALRRTVGDDAFFETLRTYTAEFADGNATTDDFVGAAERESGMELTELFDRWLYEEDVPELPD